MAQLGVSAHLLWHLSGICGVTTMPCHFVFYYYPQAVIRCSQVRTMCGPWLWQSRCCRTTTNPPACECFIKDFMHRHCEMSWSTVLQKPHLFNASSVAQVCCSVIPPLFRIWNTIDSFIIEEMWANNMTGSYASSYCRVVGGLPCQSYVRDAVWPSRQNSMGKLHIRLKINFPQDKAVGRCSISKAHASECQLMSA